MSEESLITLSEIERTATSVFRKGIISQSEIEPSSDNVQKEIEDDISNVRERKLTTKGRAYQIEMLHRKRGTLYSVLSKKISETYKLLEQGAGLRELESQRDALDSQREHFNEAHQSYHELLESFEDEEASYHWFDVRDREYQQCRMRICERIHAVERESRKDTSIKSSRSKTSKSESTKSSRLSTSSAHSRKIRAVAKAARLEAQLQFLDKEAELKKLKTLKELEMAKAERDAMKAVEDEEREKFQSPASDEDALSKSKFNPKAPVYPQQNSTLMNKPLHPSMNTPGPGLPDKMEFPANHLQDPFSCLPSDPSHPQINTELTPESQVKIKPEIDYTPERSSYLPSEPSHVPVKTEFTPSPSHSQQEHPALSPSEVALQEIVKLQVKQTELSALIAEQQRISSLPVQEPPTFSGSFFDYPIFMRAFETIIESRVSADKERLYFLNKYTSGKENEVIKGFVTLNANDSYKKAKKLLTQRFGDPHRVSNAYKVRLRNWPQITEGDSTGLQAFSDFLGQCEEAMKSVEFLNDLNSTEVLKQVSSKLPSYSGIKWCRNAFDTKKKSGRVVAFHDLVKFVESEADLATDPVFSPDVLKAERGKVYNRYKPGTNRKPRPPSSSSFAITADPSKDRNSPKPRTKTPPQTKTCPMCSKSHVLDNCDEFVKKKHEERLAFIQSKELCFGCLCKGHISKDCHKRLTCKTCGKLHPTSLHYNKMDAKEPKGPAEAGAMESRIETETNPNQAISNCSSVCHSVGERSSVTNSLIVPVWLHHKDTPQKEVMVYALVDDASDTTFIKAKTLCDLGLKGTEVKLNLFTMLGKEEISVEKLTGLVVKRVDKRVEIELPKTYSRARIPFRRNQIPRPEVASEWPHLVKIADKIHPYQTDIDVGILIGCNCPRAIKPREVILGKGDDPYAVRTLLGWGIIGPVVPQEDVGGDGEEEAEAATCNRIMTHEICNDTPRSLNFFPKMQIKEEINPYAVKTMFETDFSERHSTEQALSQEDRKFLTIVEDGIHQCESGHYEMPLPLKNPSPPLLNNREVALRRLSQLKKRFESNKKYKEDYVAFMESMIQSGYAERVPSKECLLRKNTKNCQLNPGDDSKNQGNRHQDKKVWYIPHHGVYHPKKPNKIRVVFDCSSEFKGETLNSHLLQGPDLTNNLVGVLLRFRQEPVAFMCDIESMFHQVGVTEECRDLLRFLWWEDSDLSKDPAEFRMTVHLFGATSSPGCANYALKASANDNEAELGSAPANFIRKEFYVDDGLKSVASVEEAVTLIKGAKEMCRRGGFNLHKFVSNSKDVIEPIPVTDRAEGIKNIDLDHEALPMERALGVQWCVENDSFQFRITLKDRPLTRRGILSTVSSIYDPLGLAAPLLLEGKKILQELCRGKTDWDDPVPESIRMMWQKWRKELHVLEQLSIPRCYKPANFGDIISAELHHFSDASTQGYGQCSYLRLKNDQGQIHCSFVIGKARVTPLKPITVPRLELTAAVVSVKTSEQLQRELEHEEVREVFWTDSKVVLGYIANETRRFHIFVANRVQQIQDCTSPNQWHYVDTKLNPADHASRGLSAQGLLESNWITGPAFLWKEESQWHTPSSSEKQEMLQLSDDDPEIKKSISLATNVEEPFANLLSRLDYFSDFHRAKRAIALCRSYVQKLKERTSHKSPSNTAKTSNSITVEAMEQAESHIIKAVQASYFEEEIKVLTSTQKEENPKDRPSNSERKSSLKSCSPLFKLDPFVDCSGILRVGGRLKRASMPDNVKFPVVLPRKSHITDLVIKHCHDQVEHQGRGMTLSEVRSKGFWVIGGSAAVAKCISNCVTCRKLRGTVEEQKMADFPLDRSEPAPPFTFSAVDYFGPWIVKEGRRDVKRYGVLFTCMASRAVHLELSNSLDTASFINALRRFVCRRGPVRQLRSDQGSNFVGARRELKEALEEFDEDQIKEELLKNNCDWITFKMNVPSASSMGGIWERQIRTVRGVLAAILEKNSTQLDHESLQTYLCECEAIINSRPLTVDNLSDPSSLEPLTPSHLLTMKSKVVLPPPGMFQSPDLYSRKRWRRVQHLANEFWCRWRKEFLLSLQQRAKWNHPRRNLSVGDVVIVKDDNLPRNCWQLARVSKTYPSEDGYIRSVQVDLGDTTLHADGKREGPVKQLDRPVNKLVLLLPSDADAV